MQQTLDRVGTPGRPAAIVPGLLVAASAALLALASPASAAWNGPERGVPWPPADPRGQLFVHFGEEHINDADGATLLPKVVRESRRYRPDLVTLSGDKVNDGDPEELGLWTDVIETYDRFGIPWFAGVGNHDRKAPPGFPGGVSPTSDFSPYRSFFADRPYPMGDAAPYGGDIGPRSRPAGDPEGASSHYFVDVGGRVRWIFIDNSCWSIVGCDPQQNPSAQNRGGDEAQFDFMRRVASAGSAEGKTVFVVMHMPTRDVGDQSYREPSAVSHTMGKGALGTLDNTTFEQVAAESGVDGVFVAHIKGQFVYRGQGGVPYYVDGGAGGELYTTGPVGTDHGYWHGFRLVNVRGGEIVTDTVPIFIRDGITVEGPRSIEKGKRARFEAFGRQPVYHDPVKVEALELRDPDPAPRGGVAGFGTAGVWLVVPLGVLLLAGVGTLAAPAARRRVAVPALVMVGGLGVGLVGIALGQQSEPTSTKKENLPAPARIWTTENPRVVKPVASPDDDQRRDRRTQTEDGVFRGRCPGRTQVRIASGFESETTRVVVPAGKGRTVRRIAAGARIVRRGKARSVAIVRLRKRARVGATVRRGIPTRAGKVVARLPGGCRLARKGAVELRWNGRRGRAGKGAPVRAGRYAVEVTVNGGPGHSSRVRFPLRVR